MTKQTQFIQETDLIRHTLTQPGIEVEIWNYGGIINDIRVADRDGRIESVVLGFDTLKEYRERSPYFGAIVGRVAGRIGQRKWKSKEPSIHWQQMMAPIICTEASKDLIKHFLKSSKPQRTGFTSGCSVRTERKGTPGTLRSMPSISWTVSN